jgi:hypothetical protein
MPFPILVKGVLIKAMPTKNLVDTPYQTFYDSSKGHHPKNCFDQLFKYLKIKNIVVQ